MWGSVARIVRAPPSTFVSTIERHCSGDSSRKPRLAPNPAFAKTASMAPKPSIATRASASTSLHSVTSQPTATARSAPPSSFASSSIGSVRRAPRTTRHPASAARRAVCAPMPLEAPVTRRTLPEPLASTRHRQRSLALRRQARHPAEELSKRLELAVVEGREDLVGKAGGDLSRALELAPALLREVHGVLAAIARVRAPLREPHLLELVDHRDHRARVDQRALDEVALRGPGVRVDQVHDPEVAGVEVERLERLREQRRHPLAVPGEQESGCARERLGRRVVESNWVTHVTDPGTIVPDRL